MALAIAVTTFADLPEVAVAVIVSVAAVPGMAILPYSNSAAMYSSRRLQSEKRGCVHRRVTRR